MGNLNSREKNREWTRRKHKRTADGRRFTRMDPLWSAASLARPTCEALQTERSLRQRRDRRERPISNRISTRRRPSHDCTFATLRLCVRFYSRSFVFPIRVHSRLPFAVLFAAIKVSHLSLLTSHVSPLTREAPPAGVNRAPRNTIWITDNPNASASTSVDNADAYPVSPITNPCLKM